MQQTRPSIAIVHVSTVNSDVFEEFRVATASPEVDVEVVEVDPPGIMAGIEWLMPAFVTAFVASAYFGGFFQEMGKDHYRLLVDQLKKLYPKVAGHEAPQVQLVGSKGEVRQAQPYSLYFSLMGDTPSGLRIKLLLKKGVARDEYERSVEAFLDLLKELNSGTVTEATRRKFEAVVPMGRTVLVVFDETQGEVVPIDPRTGELVR